MATIDHSRRAFFRRPAALTTKANAASTALPTILPQRPPWALTESLFLDQCSRCHQCVSSCEEDIIIIGDGRFPEVDFQRGECTFCERCVEACQQQAGEKDCQPALSIQQENQPFYFEIKIDDSCLAKQKTHCQSCKDVCDSRAISMPWPSLTSDNSLSIPAIQTPVIAIDNCNSCGACISTCPSQSISISAVVSPNTLNQQENSTHGARHEN